jgi:hypothetical protein
VVLQTGAGRTVLVIDLGGGSEASIKEASGEEEQEEAEGLRREAAFIYMCTEHWPCVRRIK